MNGEPVMLLDVIVLDGAVVDLLAGVVAYRPGSRRLNADAQVAFIGAEHHAVEVVHGRAVQAAGLDDAFHCGQ